MTFTYRSQNMPSEQQSVPAHEQLADSAGGLAPRKSSCPALSQALAQARDRCKAAAKNSVNKFQNYEYASADSVIATASEALEGSGLAIIPVREELIVLGSGTAALYALNRVLFLAHSSGEFVPLEIRGWPVIPEKGRPLDKAYAIALTTSLSYKLRDLLQMPRGEEFDMSTRDDRNTAPTPAPNGTPTRQSAVAPQQEPTPANPPSAPQADVPLTEQEIDQLRDLAVANKRTTPEVQTMLKILEVPVIHKAPRARLDWLREALTTGLTPASQVDAISARVTALGLDWELFRRRLRQIYGVTSIAHLLPRQAAEVKAKLEASPLPQAQPAMTTSPAG